MMEWATQWVGAEGKIHADKRTVEYCGRGNHSADAVCVVGSISVGNVYETRAQAAECNREGKAPCLSSPFEVKPSANGVCEANGVKAASSTSADVDSAVDGVKKNGRKHKKLYSGVASKRHKKRRVGRGRHLHTAEQDEDANEQEQEKASIPALRVPVYYFEVQILATRAFQGTSSFRRHTRLLNDSDNDDNDDDDDDGSSEMRDVDSASVEEDDDDDNDDDSEDDGDESAMDVDPVGDSRAPWRSRARRLIHDHIRATAGQSLAAGAVHVEDGTPSVGQSTVRNGGSTDSLVRSSSSSLSTTATVDSLFSLPTAPSAQQQMLLSFPLSSSTIEQIRLRLRQQQHANSQRRRLSAAAPSPSGSFNTGAVSLSTAISSIHARHQRRSPDVRRKRSNHRIAVGFMLGKDGNCDHVTRDLCHDELGRHACTIAFAGKTGSVVSNGQTFVETDTTFGYGDTIGCGVILDTRTFFWTVNGRVVATIAATDVHHLDDYEDRAIDSEHSSSSSEWFVPWAEQLHPAVSLHEHGECVRALFMTNEAEHFQFDLEAFKQQELKARQQALAAYASSAGSEALHRDDEVMHQLVEDYFTHYGYGTALASLHALHRGDHTVRLHDSDSVAYRHEIRELIYTFKTREVLAKLEKQWTQDQNSLLPLYCRILCVVDILHNGKSSLDKADCTVAVAAAQDLLQDYVSAKATDSATSEIVRAFMSVLLYPSVDKIPPPSPGRRFLVWKFREEVADWVNESLLESTTPSSALQRLTEDLCELQHQCLSCGTAAFPPCSGVDHPKSCYLCSRHRTHSRHKLSHRVRIVRLDVDSEDDQDASSSSSSASSGSENDDEDDD